MSGARADGPRSRPSRSATPPLRSRPGPLVAAAVPRAARHRVSRRHGPVRAFVGRFGWRAYAIPFLTAATLVVLVDVAADRTTTSDTSSPTAGRSTSSVLPLPDPAVAPAAPAQGDAEPTQVPAPAPEAATYVEVGAGSVSVVDGTGPVRGTGPLNRFVVEVEDGIGVDGQAFAAAVEATLGDPRSWGNGGRMSFQRVGAAEAATSRYEFKVTLVSPGTMESYCPGVGTGGYTSCRYGERAVVNLARWTTAVPEYEGDVATYRDYVVNHEVGHALGNSHSPCPGPGLLAPVMQQQTLALDGCVRNAWPYP